MFFDGCVIFAPDTDEEVYNKEERRLEEGN
jgi:hypothetical protein